MDEAIGKSIMELTNKCSTSEIRVVSAEYNFINKFWLINSLVKGFFNVVCQVWEFEGKLYCEILTELPRLVELTSLNVNVE